VPDQASPDPAALEQSANRVFAESFGTQPDGAWLAPGRVNLIGEHTDYNEGFALPFAISAGVCVAAAARADGILAVASRQHGSQVIEVPIAGLAPGTPGGWPAYPAGMAWSLRRAGYRVGGLSLAIDSDLPAGAGLSSSAAIECATALAFAGCYDLKASRDELAVLARQAENDFVGAPTGLMDQLAVLFGVAGHALLLDCRAGTHTPVPLDAAAAGLTLLILDTRAQHQLTDGGYAARRQACAAAASALGVTALREVTRPDELDGLGDPVLRRRARHVVSENERVLKAVDLLRAGQLSAIGELLTASHRSLRDDFEVSWAQADAAVSAAIEAGALGARMIGGGFGGSVIALAPADHASDVSDAVRARFAAEGYDEPLVTAAEPSPGARRVGQELWRNQV
jgi:galactokinase